MGQKKIPFGYKILNGEIKIDELNSNYVKTIFNCYLSGISTNKIAEKFSKENILNQSGKTSWTHGVIGNILLNQDYLGNNIYPQIINEQIFKQVSKIREEKNKRMNRNVNLYANSIVSDHYFNNKIICGECGEVFKKYLRPCSKGKESFWRCKNHIKNNHTSCKSGVIDDEQIEQKFNNIVNLILCNPRKIKREENVKLKIKGLENIVEKEINKKINYEFKNIYNQLSVGIKVEKIKEIENNIYELEKLIFERSAEKYKTLEIDDYKYQTNKLEEILKNQSQIRKFDQELFNKIIKRVIIFLDERIEFEFINGVKIEEKYNIKIKYAKRIHELCKE